MGKLFKMVDNHTHKHKCYWTRELHVCNFTVLSVAMIMGLECVGVVLKITSNLCKQLKETT